MSGSDVCPPTAKEAATTRIFKKKKIERGRHIGVHLTAWFPVLPEDDQSISALLFSTHGMSTRSPERNRVVSPPLLTPRYPEPVIPGAIFWLSGDGSY